MYSLLDDLKDMNDRFIPQINQFANRLDTFNNQLATFEQVISRFDELMLGKASKAAVQDLQSYSDRSFVKAAVMQEFRGKLERDFEQNTKKINQVADVVSGQSQNFDRQIYTIVRKFFQELNQEKPTEKSADTTSGGTFNVQEIAK